MYSFASAKSPDRSKRCKPYLQNKWGLGAIGSGSGGKLRTSKYLVLFEFTLKEWKILALI